MALRVLLADESSTIKKVLQLALQDLGVDVRTVHVGVDVLAVAQQFKPNIIFADVLLQKKNGYEVCQEIKRNTQLAHIPVVLMWSSFMQLDEKLAASSGADARLEKPFDVEALRDLVIRLVRKVHTNPVARFLDFSPSITDPLREEIARKAPLKNQALQSPTVEPPPPSNWNMDDFEDINKFAASLHTDLPDPEQNIKDPITLVKNQTPPPRPGRTLELSDEEDEFKSVRLGPSSDQPAAKDPADLAGHTTTFQLSRNTLSARVNEGETSTVPLPSVSSKLRDDTEPWSMQGLSSFKVDLTRSEIENADPIIPEGMSLDEIESSDIKLELFEDTSPPLSVEEERDPTSRISQPGLSSKGGVLDNAIREEVRAAVERIVRESLPQIAEQVVVKELNRILGEIPKDSEA